MSFSKLKKNRGNAMDKLRKAAEDTKTTSYEDDKLWKPTVDKTGNGYAVIRFLPAAEGQDLPWVRYWDHGFKGDTGKWYFEKCPSTIGQDCPCCQENSRLWNSGIEDDKEIARSRKRRLHYVANILVVSDSANPSTEGKVFKYEFGKKIFDKITEAMEPEFDDEEPMNPFDFWEGADFKLKIRQVAGFRNYDKSEFDKPSELLGGDDDKLEEVYNSMHDLSDYTNPETFKSFAELDKKFKSVLGNVTVVDEPVAPSVTVAEADTDDVPMEFGLKSEDTQANQDYFSKLAEED